MSALLLAAVLSLPAPHATRIGPEVPPPSIDKQPEGRTAYIWDMVQVSVSATGAGPLNYQWYHNGAPLENGSNAMGAQTPTLTMLAAAPQSGGEYYVRVSGPGGLTTSTPVQIDMVCYADCNQDQVLNLSDFGCFVTKFALGDEYADCNGCGVLALADFGCFMTKFALGC